MEQSWLVIVGAGQCASGALEKIKKGMTAGKFKGVREGQQGEGGVIGIADGQR